jgi:hypothetical protein
MVSTCLSFQTAVKSLSKIEKEGIRLEEDLVATARKSGSNLSGGFNSAEVQEGRRLLHGISKETGGLGLTLSLNNGGTLVLQSLFNLILGAFSLLLCNLLLLNGLSKF